jgi:hypothetical protein
VKILAFLLFLLSFQIGWTDDFFENTSSLAEEGHPSAQFYLGFMYYEGKVIKKDYEKALKWFLKSAEQNNKSSQLYLGRMYLNGEGVKLDEKEAFKWIKKSAEQGHDEAQLELGRLYLTGDHRDHDKALIWIRKSAEQGNDDAQFKLGLMHLIGLEIDKNEKEAFKWIKKSAEQGHDDAQFHLSNMYRKGKGVTQDSKEATEWLNKSSGISLTSLKDHIPYKIREKDLLGKIAERELGSVKYLPEILSLNPGLNPDALIVGQIIHLPPKRDKGQKKITGAFGINLGDKFDFDMKIGAGELTDGTPLHKFYPSKSFRSFENYYVLTTPKTGIVYGIWGIGSMENQSKSKKEQALIMSILEDKYGKADKDGLFSEIEGEKRIDQGNRYIIVNIEGFSDVTIDIRYYDSELKKLAEKERVELESSKLDSSGL